MKSALGLVSAVLAANVYMAVSQATVPPALANNCLYPVDLVFLVDSSESFRTSGFDDAKLFLQNVVNYFTLGENDTRVGVVTFSNDDAQITRIRLNENYTRVELLEEISNIPYDRGHTYTGLGLDHVRNNSFLEENGRRSNTLDFLVVLTDDESEDDVSGPAQLIRDMGITVFAVGVGPEEDINQAILETIAGDPNRVFRLTDHDELVDSVRARAIGGDICNATNLCDPHPCHVDATCLLLGRTFECSCNVGFVGDGFTCSVVQCPVLSAPANGALSPAGRRQYQDVVTFTCNSGYNLVGATSITCQQNGAWTASPPTCNPVQCPARAAPANGAVSPTGAVSYPNSVTFTCNSGYTLNGQATPTCQADGTWSHPVPTCTPVECPVLAVPTNGALSTAARTYQTVVTFTCNSGYVLSGFPTTTCQAGGTWSNSVPTCTPRPCPLRAAPANGAVSPTGAVSYPDGVTFTCNSGYVLNGAAAATCQASGAWSDPVPTCTPRPCPALTAPTNGALSPLGPHAFPTVVTFTCSTGYVRNGAADTTCRADGTWSNPVPTCTAVQCPARAAPANGAVNPTGAVSYPNSVTFTCNTGYTLNGVATQTCRADGTWSNNDPTCTLAQCPSLTAPANGALSTTDTSFNTVVTVTCDSGYVLNGVPAVTCQAGGTWSNTLPTCPPRTCPARAAPANGAVSPTGAVSYPNSVTFTCNTGYTLNGVAAQTCQADGTWSHPDPTCTQVQCLPLTAPANGALSTTVRTYQTVVTFTCNPGYNRNGATSATCQAGGTWSNSVPTCTPVQCPARAAPANGAVSPTGAVSYPNSVTFTCNTGYALNGVATPTCQADTTWSNPVPTCILGQCSSLTAPANGALSTTATSYLTVVTFTCNAGYVLTGATSTTCQANGAWSNPVHTCTPVQCTARTAPANGAVSPTGPVSYPGGVTFTCNSGYTLNGVATSTCQADRTWSDPVPTCPRIQCPVLTALTNGGLSTTARTYQTVVTFTCNSGYVLNGFPTTTCQAGGTWSNSVPTCTPRQCAARAAPANGAVSPTGAVSYPNSVTFTCNSGYQLIGVATPTCQADGTWSSTVPTCIPRPCLTLTAPANGALSPLGPHAFPTVVTFTCNSGYVRNGAADTTCRADGTWSNPVPTCTRVQCPALTAPTDGGLSPAGPYSYQDVVTFSCNTGYRRNGATSVTCRADGTWSSSVPTCELGQCLTLTPPTNGALNPPGATNYQDVVTFTCNSGYVLNGAASVTCQADGTWSNPVPTCPPRQCPPLTAPTNGVLSTTSTSYLTVVGFTCNSGYVRTGAATATCQDDGTWSGSVPTCTRIQCSTLTAPSNGALSPAAANSYQDVVTFTCNSGYTLNGATAVTCRADGTWSNPVPTCTGVQCPALTAPANGGLSPTGAVSYPNEVTFTCDPGYRLVGVDRLACRADGTWNNVAPTCRFTIPTPLANTCPYAVDLVFLVDSSSSWGANRFENAKTFVQNVANYFTLGENDTRVGVVTYNDFDEQVIRIRLNENYTRVEALTAIRNIPYESGISTFTGRGLEHVSNNSFLMAFGQRKNMLVVLTDGNSTDDVNATSQYLRRLLVSIFAVGVGEEADVSQDTLQTIAGDPTRVFRLTSYDFLTDDNRAASVRQSICDAVRCPALPAPTNGALSHTGLISPQTVVTFTCNPGYSLDGQSTITCLQSGFYTGPIPTCIPVQCPNLTAPANGAVSPTGAVSYPNGVTFSCDSGYGLTGVATLTCRADGTWSSLPPTCQPGQCSTLTPPTNGALSPVGATSFQNVVTFTCNQGYERNGASSVTCQANLIWSAPVPTCDRVQCPLLGALANGVLSPSGATSYQDVVQFICNQGYEVNGPASTTCQADQTWSNPVRPCQAVQCPTLTTPANGGLNPAGPHFYQNQVTFTCNQGYGLSGASRLTCQADGMWSNSVPSCILGQCPTLAAPANGGLSPTGTTAYQTVVTFTCNLGYQLVGDSSTTCQAGLTWSSAIPTCQPVPCPTLAAPANGIVSPTGAASYQDQVQFICNAGYSRVGAPSSTCQANGTWSDPVPACNVVQCPTLVAPTNGALSPTGATSYLTVVTFICNTGYDRNGAADATCQADGTWSRDVPTCTAVTCPTLTNPANGVLSPSGANSYQNTVTLTCDAGYQSSGVSTITCQADRSWSAAIPTCNPVQCQPLTAPINGGLSPAGATSYQVTVLFTCNQGYELVGATSATCRADQTWSETPPTCRVVQCPLLSAPVNGALSPPGATSYNDAVTFTCGTGYQLNGPSDVLTCRADGTWSNTAPTCTVVRCLALTAPANGALSPAGANSYTNVVTFTCNQGYERQGASSATCQADGTWSNAVATCIPVQCQQLTAPANGVLSPTGAISYQNGVDFSCNVGYQLNGASRATCQADQTWSANVPTCTVVQCPLLTAPANGALSPAGVTAYNTVVRFTCVQGYVLTGAADVTCQADGTWSARPTCRPVQCPILSAPDNGSLSTGANSYQTVVTFNCNLGYERVGFASAICQFDSTWSNTVPTCRAVQCPLLTHPANGVVNPIGRNSYQDVVRFTCNTGFELNGEPSATCRADRTWSEPVPTCTDINECRLNMCHSLATCTNTIGSFRCNCFSGYSGDGFTCRDINECAPTSPCHQWAVCTNLPGSFMCNCTEGYIGNGFICAELPCDRLDLAGWDLVFLLDSADLGDEEQTFNVVKSFARETIDGLIDSDGVTHIGLVQYNENQQTAFNLNQYQTKADILAAVDNINYLGGGTYTGRAIHFARQDSFAPENGNRANRPDAMIVITDGVSLDPITYASTASRHQGITVFAVGVGDRIDRATLEDIAEEDQKVLQVSDAASRTQAIRSLKSWLCRGVFCGDPGAPASGAQQGTYYQGGQVDFSCDDGYTLVGNSAIRCQVTATWSGTLPTCRLGDPCAPNPCINGGQCFPTITSFRCRCASGYLGQTCNRQLQCPTLQAPTNGNLSPIGVASNQTVVTFTCNSGYTLTGDATTTCQADERWSNPVPTCTPVQCPARAAPANGAVTPTGAVSYPNAATFTCISGYTLNGQATPTCQADGTWSHPVPTCQAVQCTALTAPANGAVSPTGAVSYPNSVTFTCNSGYTRNGATGSTCQADGTWSNPVHTCTAVQCPARTAPANGAVSPTGAVSYPNGVTFTCNSGYTLNGVATPTCRADGTWSSPVPTCQAVQCPARVAPANGAVSPTGAVSYPNGVTFTCNSGYTLSGVATPTCQADTTWSNPVPTCQAVQCPARAAPANGAVSPTGAVSYPNGATFTCNSGYTLNGVATPTCQADGTWNNPVPTCQPVQCPARAAPANGAVSPTGAVSYPNSVTFTCNSGYTLNGVAAPTCQADTTWSNPVPTCQAVQCPARTAPANGAVSPTGAVSYPNSVTFTCNSGYTLNGVATPTCQAAGTWSNPVPSCTPRPCPTLTAPTNGALSPLGPHAFPTVVTFTCNTGYVRNGAADTTCRADGTWSNPVPTCTVGQCPSLTAPANGAISTTETSFNTVVTFTCNTGYTRNGATSTTCQDGTWSNPIHTCTPVQCSARTAPANGAVTPTGAVSYPNGVTFTCSTGYRLNGVATPTCQADTTWSNTVPTCELVQCPARAGPANGAVSPTGAVSYPNSATFTCNTGYQLNGVAAPTCQADGTWSSPVPTCTPVQCPARAAPANGAVSPTGAVSYPNSVTFTCNTGYQLNGADTATCQAGGTWSPNTVPTCDASTLPPALPTLCPYPVDLVFLVDSSESFRTSGFEDAKTFVQNVVNYFTLGEDDTRVGVVTYSNEDEQVTRIKLNEKYDRVELLTEIRNIPYDRGHTFTGLGLDHVRNNSFLPANGRRSSTPDFLIVLTDDESEDSVSGPAQLVRDMGITVFVVGVGEESDISQATLETIAGDASRVFRLTDHDFLEQDARAAPIRENICNAIQCPTLTAPANGALSTTDTAIRTVVTTTCNAGYQLGGAASTTCQAGGTWSHPVPTCTPVQCPARAAPANGAVTPTGAVSYPNSVTFSCNTGYTLNGQATPACQAPGTWSHPVPTCQAVQCPARTAPANGAVSPTGAVSYPNGATFTCNSGYTLNGQASPTCQADGTWSHPVPTCQARQCPARAAPANGAVTPTGAVSYPNGATFTCNSGYTLNGQATPTCQADGTWSHPVPTCTLVQCPARVAPANGAVSPTGAVSYPNGVTFTCNTGYQLNGQATPTCQADGTWSSPVPTCQPRTCSARTAPANGAVSPTGAVSYPNSVTFTCNTGYRLNGAAAQTCQADTTWSHPDPTCTLVQCPARTAPANGAVTPTGAVSYPNGVTFTCNSGYALNGVAAPTCQADGTWSSPDPTCTRVQCAARAAPANGVVSPTGAVFSPSSVTFTCNSGYVRTGAASATCQADGTWSDPVPTCNRVQCPSRAAPANGAVNPTGTVFYPAGVTFSCNTGYTLSGQATPTCQADGTWSHPVPTCAPRQCPALTAPAFGVLRPIGARSYQDTVTFECNPGYTLNGATSATCRADGTWSDTVPTCTPVQCPARAAPANGAVSPTGAVSYPNGVTFTCNTGYTLNGQATPTCQAAGTWSHPVPTCQAVQCPVLNPPTNGALSPTGTRDYQTVVTFTCDPGYELVGATTTTCQADGRWSNSVPTCRAVQCNVLTAPVNGALSPVGANSYRDVVTFTCNQGYDLIGAASITCQGNRTWSKPEPICRPESCDRLDREGWDIVFLMDSTSSVKFGRVKNLTRDIADRLLTDGSNTRVGVVQFSNNPAAIFELNTYNTKSAVITAINAAQRRSGGTFAGSALTYVKEVSFSTANGGRPDRPDALIVVTDGMTFDDISYASQAVREQGITTFAVGAGDAVDSQALRVMAVDPYKVRIVTNDTQHVETVEAIWRWFCLADVCTRPANPANGIRRGTIYQGERMYFSCDDNFVLDGTTPLTCTGTFSSSTGSWSAAVPTCKPACTPNPCLNGGVCTPTPSGYRCQCPPGLFGRNCDSRATTPMPGLTTRQSGTGSGQSGLNLDRLNGPGWDLVFLLDSSDSVGMPGFLKVRNVTEKIVERLPLRNNETHIGLAQYSDQTKQESLLKNYQNKNATLEKIQGIMPLGGGTLLGEAITNARTVSFSEENGNRPNIPDALVVVTDANFRDDVVSASEAARKQGIHVFAVGVGPNVDRNKLVEIAGREDRVFIAPTTAMAITSGNNMANWLNTAPECSDPGAPSNGFTQGTTFVTGQVDFGCNDGYTLFGPSSISCNRNGPNGTWSDSLPVCRQGDPCSPNPCPSGRTCTPVLVNNATSFRCIEHCPGLNMRGWDLLLLVDGSREAAFSQNKAFARDLVDRLPITDQQATNIGLVQFSDTTRQEFHLNRYSSKQSVLAAIGNMRQTSGGSFVGSAIDYARLISFTADNGNRANVPDGMVVVTDGRTDDAVDFSSTAARHQGITIFAVGIGDMVNRQTLDTITRDPDKVLLVTTQASKTTAMNRLTGWLCRGIFCDDPGAPRNGSRRGNFFQGGYVDFFCDDGFILNGATPTRCQTNTNWTEPVPVCGLTGSQAAAGGLPPWAIPLIASLVGLAALALLAFLLLSFCGAGAAGAAAAPPPALLAAAPIEKESQVAIVDFVPDKGTEVQTATAHMY
ncbi:uncharacterized protein LOC144919463 isoform X5 [Branchiostoma floridae x Branchiostoma belcheri]